MNLINREKIATLCLVLCMFFNPLGFDALFKMVMELTGSYWITDLIFYLTSALFLGLYFLLHKINPVNHVKQKFKKNGEKL
jgi:hypothetical protein